jgi:hypothetical protein
VSVFCSIVDVCFFPVFVSALVLVLSLLCFCLRETERESESVVLCLSFMWCE